MRNIVFAVVAAATLGTFGTASAADLPARYPNATPPAPVILPVFSWTGCYLGGFASGAWGNDLAAYDRSNLAGQPGPPFDAWSYKLSTSFIGGGTVGCNWQPVGTPFVAGVEGEFGYLKLSGSSFDPLDPIGPNNILSTTKIGDWYGMLTGRLGYAWDRALFYVKGGAASASRAAVPPPIFRYCDDQAASDSLAFLSGSMRTRRPVAANTAFATAGAIGAVPGSPMPPHFLPPLSAR